MTHHKTIVLSNRDRKTIADIMECIERLERAEREKPSHPTSTGVECGYRAVRNGANSFLGDL